MYNARISIPNMDQQADVAELQELFGAYGRVRRIRVIKNTVRGELFAVVEMQRPAEASSAYEALNGSMRGGRRLELERI